MFKKLLRKILRYVREKMIREKIDISDNMIVVLNPKKEGKKDVTS